MFRLIIMMATKLFGGKVRKLTARSFPRLYRFAVSMRWKGFMKTGDTVIQVGVDMGTKNRKLGSNIMEMLRVVGETGRVVGIEPFKESVDQVKTFIRLKKISNMKIIERAVWKEKGELIFLVGKESWDNQLAIVPGASTISSDCFFEKRVVQADTLDNILRNQGIEDFSHVCMTINGAELEALEGMTQILKRKKLSMLIASGNSQRFRPTANGIPLNKRIVEVLEANEFRASIDNEGWISAFKGN